MANISERIKELRLSRQMTQTEFGNVFGIVKSTISLYESGKSTPNDQIKTKICEYFNVSMDYLLGITDISSSNSPPQERTGANEEAGGNLAYWIRKTGLSYAEVAEKVGVSESLLEDYCSGCMEPPLEVLEGLAKLCSVSTDCLLGFREKSRPAGPDGNIPFRFDPEISRRLKSLAQQMEETYGAIADQLGIEESEVFNFFEYGFVPHISIFAKIVEHYLISSDYLLNLSNSTMTVRPDEEKLLSTYRGLTEKNKVRGLSRLYDLEEAQSAVAATGRALDSQGKSLPSSGTEGGLVG